VVSGVDPSDPDRPLVRVDEGGSVSEIAVAMEPVAA
jgi:hypothetical protein